MIELPPDHRPPLSPQLAARVAILGTFTLAMFAIIFFRLWFLQVLSGDQYVAQARANRTRSIAIQAPRGEILDRSGNVLVKSTPTIAVQITPSDLPSSQVRLRQLYGRLAGVLGTSRRLGNCRVAGHGVERLAFIPCEVAQQRAMLPYANVLIKTDVQKPVHYYLAENAGAFPGVNVEQVYLRDYPLGETGAQLFGTIGPISSTCTVGVTPCVPETRQSHFRGVSHSAIVGQSGLEYYYDHYLRGSGGAQKVQVNAAGNFAGNLPTTKPVAGDSLELSIDAKLQKAGEQALQQSIDSNSGADAGAFVALDPNNGQVLAMGSNPSFNPNVFNGAKPISQTKYNQLFGPGTGFPLLNRAIQSAEPTGSTFKPFTATAALQSGAWSLGDTYDDGGQFCVDGQCRHNSGNAAYGVLDLVNAIRVSSDDFFYNLGARTNANPIAHPNGGALQHWARLYGIGRPTGIDLGGEVGGNLPTPATRAKVNRLETECDNATGPFKGKPKHAPGGCGVADGTNRHWSIGDNISLGVGQGDVQVTPLQLAVAYSAIENGGTVVRPHLGRDVQSQDGTVIQKIDPRPARHIAIDPQNLGAIRQGLRDAASQPGGTSYEVFGSFPEPVYGKTGTAQQTGQADSAWYACYVPDPGKPIVVVVTVPHGGFGAAAAAPVAREILSQWFSGKRGSFVSGTSHTL